MSSASFPDSAAPAPSSGPPHPANRLARETSPYLLQHAHNPVDWYPWGPEAFARARELDRPILLSVGYATCHWCHVMERESFEDEAVARQLAEGFIAIKVDREELPDVDHVYMRALQAITGRGGWPMNMFLTPDLKPFFGGTYFPPRPRPGFSSFSEVLTAVREAWERERAQIEEQAQALHEHLDSGLESALAVPHTPGARLHAQALDELLRRFDPVHGGFGRAPKFPQAPLLQYLLSVAATGEAPAREMLLFTLQRMAEGGVYDQLGGGFARYSTDERWQVPHFEKMLYDNAQLARVYAGAWRLCGESRLRFVAEDTLAYLLREMHPAAAPAAFSSAQDADTEGEEGRFHVWTLAQLREALGADADMAARLHGATDEGNWEEGEAGRNVLERRDPEAARAALGLDEAAFAAWERSVRERLYAARSRRVWPLTDDKVLADWNGLALRALAEAGRLLGRADFVQAAEALARFLLQALVQGDRVHHAWRNGTLRGESYLSDQAQLGLGLLELHAANGAPEWFAHAQRLADGLMRRHHDPARGFFDNEAGPALPLRARDIQDGAVPSGTAAACELLLRLAGPCGRTEWRDAAVEALQRLGPVLAQSPLAVPALLHAQLLAERGADLAVPAPGGAALWEAARSSLAPLVTLVRGGADTGPLLQGRRGGEAYLCRDGACALPATTVEELQRQLGELHAGLAGAVEGG
ncbi:thioredoxin domain-containing protein [Azohydromonas caseinilytica]|uniref:Thioredoxin domain-containing protein n=1 Tax=Azohydromonas caseinilytica TaxID=2728836 RepID=A0A848FG31_9BURK|nr:thioredoxin domain-containing protein [Azohydromonas caseinilytica]NML17269.1 thioredoxin domain-containing protein [Azohydromonas caseinilytica]